MGSRKIFRPRRLTTRDARESRLLQKAMSSQRESLNRTAVRYNNFCRFNLMSPWSAQSMLDFCGQHTAQGLAASTTGNLVGDLLKLEAERRMTPARTVLLHLKKIYSLRAAAKGVKHSLDINLPRALRVVGLMNGRLQAAAAAMLICGYRFADLQRATGGRFRGKKVAGRWQFVFDLAVAKNRRSTRDRFRVHLGRELRRIPGELLSAVAMAFRRCSFVGRPFAFVDRNELTTALREASAAAFGAEDEAARELTPGSLRRCYVQQRIHEHTDEDGHVSWERVIEKTGHKKVSTVQAHYVADLR